MHYYQFNFNDFIAETRFLDNQEISVFIKLQMQYLKDEKPLKNNIVFLSRLCGASESETMNVLEIFYELKEDHWCRDQLDRVIANYKNNIEANSRGGKKSAEARRMKDLAGKYTSTDIEVTKNHELNNQKLLANKPVFNKYQAEKPSDVGSDIWRDYLILRKAKESPLTKAILASIRSEAEAEGLSLNDALKICVERSWIGFKAEWLNQDYSYDDDEYED